LKKIRVAVIGCGRMGKRHAEAYHFHPSVEIKGFYDIKTSLASNLASKYNARVYTDMFSAIEDHVDAISVCTPNSLHFDILKSAIRLEKHILVEKPIVITLEHCNLIEKMMRGSSSKVMVGHIHRFFPCNIALKSVINSNKIGTPIVVNTFDYIPGKNPGESVPHWMMSKKFGGGGVLMNDLIHTVDKISWLLNSSIKKVFTPTMSSFGVKGDVENVGIVILWMANGAVATCTHGCPSPGSAEMSTKIIGVKGEVTLKFAANLEINKKSKSIIKYKHKGNYLKQSKIAFESEINEFVKSIKENRAPKVSYKDGIKAVKVILALYDSFKSKQPILVKI